MNRPQQRTDIYACTEHQRQFNSHDAYLEHRVLEHDDRPIGGPSDIDADTREISGRAEGDGDGLGNDADDPLAGLESAKSQQSDEPGERIIANAQVEDEPARLEDVDPVQREVHRPPTSTDGNPNSR